MMKQKVNYYEIKGTHYEIGKQLAQKEATRGAFISAPAFWGNQELEEALTLYDQYCPGIVEELKGYADVSGGNIKDIAYTWMSYLVPRCSGLIVLGSQMNDGHTRLARNYEFSVGTDEEVALCKTMPEGKYAHIGGPVVVFGRHEGINECGLAVSMSSCGLPVSNIEGMRPAGIKGLQFWAVIRSLLENCKNVEEALKLALEMPIAFNVNLYLADASGKAALIETMNGKVAYEIIDDSTTKKYLYGTNHIVIPSFQKEEPMAMENSIVRYNTLKAFTESHKTLKEEEIKDLLLAKYPEGMTAYYYDDWFGTVKSIVMDTASRRLSVCWFGQAANGWEDYTFEKEIKECSEEKYIQKEQPVEAFFSFKSL